MKTEVVSQIIQHLKNVEIDVEKSQNGLEDSEIQIYELSEFYLTFCGL